MSDNKALSRKWFEEGWNQRRCEAMDEISAPDSVGYLENNQVLAFEEFKNLRSEFLTMFPDLAIEIEGMIADGDEVVTRWIARGTHQGDGMGLAATGMPVEFRGTTWHRYRDGKMIEGRDYWNQGALVQRLQDGARAGG